MNVQEKHDFDDLCKEIYKLVAMVDSAKMHNDHLNESLSRIKEEADHIKERRSRSRA